MPVSPSPLNYFLGKGIVKLRSTATILSPTVDITSGSTAATLSADTGLVDGTSYRIDATGIPPGTTFPFTGSTAIVLSANATATAAAAAATITGDYRDLGNVPEFSVTPAVERLDHFLSRTGGTKVKDRSVVRQVSLQCRFILEEWTPENLALFFLGTFTPPVDPAPYSTIDLLSLPDFQCAARLIGTNDIGDKVQVDVPNLNIAPAGALGFIADDWGRMEINGEVLYDAVGASFGTILHGITGEVLL